MRALAPVVEVAGDHKRRVARNHARDQIKQAFELLLSVRFTQPEMHAYRMQLRCARNVEHTMQHSSGSASPTDTSMFCHFTIEYFDSSALP